jgi:phage terminase large subunit
MPTVELDLLTPAWAEPLLVPARYKGAKGGRSSGKSHFFAEMAVEEMVSDPSLRFVCIREVQRSLKFSAKSLIESKIRKMGVSHLFQVLEREIRRVGGTGVMIFEGMQDHTADSLKSLEGFGRAWCEEAQALSKRSLDLLLPTIRAEGSEIWFSWNPDQPTDPVDQLLVANQPANAVVVHVNYTDNPFCPQVSKDEARLLRSTDPDAYDHVWGGGYNKRSASQVLRGKWAVDQFEPVTWESLANNPFAASASEEWKRSQVWDGPYHGADFGFAEDPTTLLRLWIHDRRLYVERESYARGLELDDTPRRWKMDVPGCERYVVRADSSRPDSISYLRRHGIPQIEGAPKGAGSVEDGVAHLRQYDKIIIHEQCTHTAEEARLYSHRVDQKTGDVMPDIVDKHNHCMDAIRYALAPLIKVRPVFEEPEPSTSYSDWG